MSDEIPMVSLVKKGTNEFPRYILAKADAFKNPIYWDAANRRWHEDESKATIFADITQACWEHHDLLIEAIGDRPCHLYIAPVYVEIYGDKPNLADLQAWLEKAIRIVVDSPKHGLGPDGTVGIVILDAEKRESV